MCRRQISPVIPAKAGIQCLCPNGSSIDSVLRDLDASKTLDPSFRWDGGIELFRSSKGFHYSGEINHRAVILRKQPSDTVIPAKAGIQCLQFSK